MARIRLLEIHNFRGIETLSWFPASGFNCLIGPGDVGKSTILEAIDLCLSTRQNLSFTDADFFSLDVDHPIAIQVTLGDLEDELMRLDAYGMFLRGFDPSLQVIHEEPGVDLETVLTVCLTVSGDLEPQWTLISQRALEQNLVRYLGWADRARIAPSWVGTTAGYHMSWRRGSVLNKLSEERADASTALAKAAREARLSFGNQAEAQLGKTLSIVSATASSLGIEVGQVKAMLDAHSVSIGGGTIALHTSAGVPLGNLGMGSTRLLTAGLQRHASATAPLILIDEVEHGLEPHRIIRLLDSLGAKDQSESLQVFMSTHSPVVIRELSARQLFVVNLKEGIHRCLPIETTDDNQSTLRTNPEAFLAVSVLVCEGASEVGFMRGLDRFRVERGFPSIHAAGVVLVDGGGITRLFGRANVFLAMSLRAGLFRDDDNRPPPEVEEIFRLAGGAILTWRSQRALEDELFWSLSNDGVSRLIEFAIRTYGEEVIDAHIKSASQGSCSLSDCRVVYTDLLRQTLGTAAKSKKLGWFKTVSLMEDVAYNIVGPDLASADPGFRSIVNRSFQWAVDA